MAKGFKEWQVVCDALASGRQSIILRKGGIHEGREGFSFGEELFYLFPTRFHNQTQFVREGSVDHAPEWEVGDEVSICHHGEAVWAKTLTDWDQVAALQDLHIWTEETVRQRFDWEGKGMAAGSIHVALVRIRELLLGNCFFNPTAPSPRIAPGWRGCRHCSNSEIVPHIQLL